MTSGACQVLLAEGEVARRFIDAFRITRRSAVASEISVRGRSVPKGAPFARIGVDRTVYSAAVPAVVHLALRLK